MISVFLPCRAGSQRVPKKNILPIGKYNLGLTEIKLHQLEKVPLVSEVVLSTDDEVLINELPDYGFSKLKIVRRSAYLATSSIPTDKLVKHAAEITAENIIMWTHVTSPFYNTSHYTNAIDKYFSNLNQFDSLMTVHQINEFIWKDGKPMNYDRSEVKWPATQNLDPLFIVDSCCFIAAKTIYQENCDRIGAVPYLAKNNGLSGFDIDWPEDYEIAKTIIETKPELVL